MIVEKDKTMSSHQNYSNFKKLFLANFISKGPEGDFCIENPCRADFIWVNNEKQLEELADDLIKFGERLKQEAKVSK